MLKHKRVKDEFKWVPMHKRMSKFGGPMSPRKPDTRKPLLWLTRKLDELYLVNETGETLTRVQANTVGWITADDDVANVESNEVYEYKDVKPNEAVLVEEYDGYYDLDYVLMTGLAIESPSLGTLHLRSPGGKGGDQECVLLEKSDDVSQFWPKDEE